MYLIDRPEWQRVMELTLAIKQLSEKWNSVVDGIRWKISITTPIQVPVELHVEEYQDKVDNELRLVLEGDANYIYARDKIQQWKDKRKEIVERLLNH